MGSGADLLTSVPMSWPCNSSSDCTVLPSPVSWHEPEAHRRPVDTELIRRVVHALDEAGVAHMLTGSLASAYHGEPRATRDIDVVIDPDGGSIELLVEAFPPDRFYVGDAAGAVDRRDMFRRSFCHDQPSADASLRSEIDQPIGSLDDVEVVLDHQHRVALIDEA